MKIKYLLHIGAIFFLFFIYKNLFLAPDVIGGDWAYFYPETLKTFFLLPPAWVSYMGNGFGGPLLTYALDSYLYFVSFIGTHLFQYTWSEIGKMFYFFPFFILSIFSSYYLNKVVFEKFNMTTWLSIVIFTANTYVLMLVGGGQMGVALAYSILPLILGLFFRLSQIVIFKSSINKKLALRYLLLCALAFSLCIIFDTRIAYLIAIAIALFYLVAIYKAGVPKFFLPSLIFFSCSLILSLAINAFWIIPFLIYRSNPANQLVWDYGSSGLFKFLSFAFFPQSISLLQPNWPENIFGKIYFMMPEFIVLPIVAFTGLFFLPKEKNRKISIYIVFLSLLGLIGAFLGKGTNAPFGQINEFLYEKIPGFAFFRDPIKFYMFVALSYSILIPYSLIKISDSFGSMKNFSFYKRNINTVVFLIFTAYYFFTIHAAILGSLSGTLKQKQVPDDYVRLKDFIISQPEFFRTLWLPRQQRFNFYSNVHPAVSADLFFKEQNFNSLSKKLKEEIKVNKLQNASIKYIIVPGDTYGEIFTKDRKFDQKQNNEIVKSIKKISDLKEVPGFGKIKVFIIENPASHIFSKNAKISAYKMVSPDKYEFKLTAQRGSIVYFNENYSRYWKLNLNNREILSTRTQSGFNSFIIPSYGTYFAMLNFSQETGYYYARIFSLVILLCIAVGIYTTIEYRNE